VSAGTYVVRVVAKKGYTVTTPSKGLYSITVKAGMVVRGKAFGEGK
jgi:hypothetical protein